MTRALQDCTVLVTGAAAGIGYAVVRQLCAAGARVVGMDVRRIAEPLAGARFVAGDVRSPEAFAAAVGAAEAWTGDLDAAVLNAGVASAWSLLRAEPAEIERVLAIDLLGVILGVRAALPALRRRGGGAIVATSSLAGLIPYEPDPVYAAAKHGVVGFVRSIAPALANEGITVNAVCPGLTETAILPERVRAAARQADFPLIHADDIARAIVGCLTQAATGQALVCQAGRPPIPYTFRGVPGPAGGIASPGVASGVDG